MIARDIAHISGKYKCILYYVFMNAFITFYYEYLISSQILQIIATDGPP